MPTGLGGHLGICCRTSESGYPHQVCIVGRAPVGGQKMTSQNVPLWHKDDFKLKVNETADAKGTLFCTGKGKRHGTTGNSYQNLQSKPPPQPCLPFISPCAHFPQVATPNAHASFPLSCHFATDLLFKMLII